MGDKRMIRRMAAIRRLLPDECASLVRRNLVGFSLQGDCPDLALEQDEELVERKIDDAKAHSGSSVGQLVLDNLLIANCQTPAAWKALADKVREVLDHE